MSGALDLPVVMNAVNRGEVTRLIAKPFHLGTLFAALDEALAERARLEQVYTRTGADILLRERCDLESCFSGCLLQLALQPLAEAGTGAVRGYAALLRSRHPSLDSPLRVMGAAEQHGLLDRRADRVGEAAAGWLAQLPAPLMLFINAHPDELADLPAVRQRLAPPLDSASRLVIEITERSGVLERTDWPDAIVWLTEAGFRIAIDDLGSGDNSPAVLAELQPPFLKVDMGIVRHIDREERKQRLVELLSRFAQASDSRVVLEGIETDAEATTAHRLGVDLLQGELFGRPSLTL